MSHLQRFAYRGRVRSYAGFELLAAEAVVASATAERVTVVTASPTRIHTLELTVDQFLTGFAPDLTSTPERAARALLAARHCLRAGPDVFAPLTRILNALPQEPSMAQSSAANSQRGVACHADAQRRTCIELARFDGVVRFIPLESGRAFDVQELDEKQFAARYVHPLPGHPATRAAAIYVEYARHLGATEAAIEALARLTPITREDAARATRKLVEAGVSATAAAAKAEEKTAAQASKAAAQALRAAARKTPAEPARAPVASRTAAVQKMLGQRPAPKRSAAAAYRELILAGELTDAQIYAAIVAEFGPDQKNYVEWYRRDLTKKGANPPAPKE